ncbi:MAG TPA: fatty acid--CoA ligase family protein [Bacteriovoracaceae bacterium]|nr:fatty acid--CoA ligase family protein [Bacteriovoracaceae bacterium]
MKTKIITLTHDGLEIQNQLDDLNFTITPTANPEITPVACDDAIEFYSAYKNILLLGNVPLILNPAIPEHKRNEMTEVIRKSVKAQSGEHILCSSGTTSKGVVGKQFIFKVEDAIKNGEAHLASVGITSSAKILLPLPVSHSFGLVAGILGPLHHGHDLFMLSSTASASAILSAVEKFNIDHLYLTPSLVKMVIKMLKRKKITLSYPKSISIGSSLLFIDELLTLMSFFPETHFYFTYGLTEMGPRTFTFDAGKGSNPHAYLVQTKTGPVPIGKVLEGVSYQIVDGELYIKSPYKARNIEEEFYGTKDRADETSAGVRVHGRMDFTIIKGGVNIYPAEVESLLSDFSGIQSCALVPLKSESYGQVPVLVVYSEEDNQELIPKIQEFLQKNLPPGHLPSRIVLRTNDFPRTSMGKIKVNTLIEELDNE